MEQATFFDACFLAAPFIVLYGLYCLVNRLIWWFGGERRGIIRLAAVQLKELETALNTSDDLDEVAPADIAGLPKRRPKRRGSFRAHLVVIAKAKFGCPKRTVANSMCIRKFLYDYCVDNNVLPRHIAMNVDFAVESVFVPTEDEVLARAVAHGRKARDRVEMRDSFGGPTPTC
jgi:hypothetical protein